MHIQSRFQVHMQEQYGAKRAKRDDNRRGRQRLQDQGLSDKEKARPGTVSWGDYTGEITLKEVVQAVENETGVLLIDMRRKSRARTLQRDDVVIARQLVAVLGYELSTSSFADIGRCLHRDHTTVMHMKDKTQCELFHSIAKRIRAALNDK